MATDEIVRISFIGDANFSDVSKQAKLLQAQFAAIQKAQLNLNKGKAFEVLESNVAHSSKMAKLYSTQVTSSSERLTEAISKQTVTFRQAWQQRKVFNQVIKEQIALQKSLATISEDRRGVKTLSMWGLQADKLSDSAISLSARMGTLSAAIKASSKNLINWGKNTQWAGRQMMVGLGVPIAALGVATGKLANDTDKQLTRIAKVYGDASSSVSTDFAKLRADGIKTYQQAAKLYGMSADEVLGIQADLAAAGREGQDLQKQTLLVAKAMTLGEASQADAMKGVIALQSVYHMNTKKIADALNYMNSVENASNLSFQDFIEAIPRGAGILSKMGASLQDLGALLVAVKQSGIDAAQGMRGIASGAQSLLKIAPQTEKLYKQLTGDSLKQTVIDKQGNFVKILYAMSDAMKKLEPYQKQQIISQIFGKFQAAKMLAVLDSFINKTNQVSSVMKINKETTEQWADTANQELEQIRKSLSGRFKIAVEEFKNSLMPIGNIFLEIGTAGAKFFTKLAKTFNGLPTWTKWIIAFGAGFTALVGVLTMVTGVIANLLGHAGELVAFIMGKFARGQTFMTKQEKALNLILQESTEGVLRQNGAINDETVALERATKAMQSYITHASRMNSERSNFAVRQMINTGATDLPYIPKHAKSDPLGMATAAMSAKQAENSVVEVEKHSKVVRTNMLSIAGSLAQFGVGALAVNNMVKGSHSLMDNILNVSLLAGSVGPLLARGFAKAKIGTKLAGWITGALRSSKISTAAVPLAARIGTAMKTGIMTAMSSPLTGVIAAGLGAVAVGIYAIKKHQEAVLNEQSDINEETKEWAEQSGGVEKHINNIALGVKRTKRDMKEINETKQYNKFVDANEKLIDQVTKLDSKSKDLQNTLLNFATIEAQAGKSNKAIQQDLENLLRASGHNPIEMDQILVHLKKINFDDPKQASKAFYDAIDNAVNQYKNINPVNLVQMNGFKMVVDDQYLSEMRAAGKKVGDAFATSSAREQQEILQKQVAWEANLRQQLFLKIQKKHAEQLKSFGVTDASQMTDNVLRLLEMSSPDDKLLQQWDKLNSGLRVYDEGLKSSIKVSNGAIDKNATLGEVYRQLYGGLLTVAQAQAGYKLAIENATEANNKLTDSQKLQILNQYRVQAGLDKTKTLTDGFGQVTKKATDAVKDSADAQKDATHVAADYSSAIGLINSAMNNQITSTKMASTIVDAYKDAMKTAQDTMLQAADDALSAQEQQEKDALSKRQSMEKDELEKQQQAETDALDKQNQARQDAFDKRSDQIQNQIEKEQRLLDQKHERETNALEKQQQAETDALEKSQRAQTNALQKAQKEQSDALEKKQNAQTKALEKAQKERRNQVAKGYNDRISEINKEIAAEQHAEDVRQRIFEAEQTRLQRASQMKNAAIDFNVAVDTGQLDEAAKIMNDSQAQTQEWANQDSSDKAKSASQKRIDALQEEIKQIEKQRDKRLKALAQIDKAEKKQLEREQKRERDAMKERQKRQREELADRQRQEKRALQRREKMEKNALKKRQDAENYAEKQHERQLKDALAAERKRWQKYYAAAKTNLERTQKAQNNALDQEQKSQDNALDRMQKRRRTAIDDQIDVLRNSIPRTKKQFQQQERTVLKVYDDYGVKIKTKGSNWSQTIANGLSNAIHGAAVQIQNDQDWQTFSKNILKQATKGIGMTVGQFMKFAQTGQLPKKWRMPKNSQKHRGSRIPTPDIPGSTYHDGGEIGPGMGSGRGGMTGPVRSNERMILAKDKEFMINDRAARSIGYGNLKHMNATGQLPVGGADIGTGGLAFLPTVAMGAAIMAGIQSGVRNTFARQAGGTFKVAAGPYGDSGITLDAERARNAGIVVQAGKKIGATNRDIIIALMTALQESGLHNYRVAVDHDSLGIFQQRASWGSVQQRTDPMWAATEFFRHLLKIKNRDSMSLGQAAQAVQISAFPGAYAKWEDEAREIFAAAQLVPDFGKRDAGQMPGDYEKVQFRGVTLDRRTVRMIQEAERIGWPTGRMVLYQGSFNDSVAASAGTHSGGGAIDVGIDNMNERQQDKAVEILRRVGFAAWERHPWEGFIPHIHAIAIGDKLMSSAAARQVVAFKHHRDGLADNGPDTWPDVGGWGDNQTGREGLVPMASGPRSGTINSLLPMNQGKRKLRLHRGMRSPVESFQVSRKWADHDNQPRATDMAAAAGAIVKAVTSGLVTKSADMRGFNPYNNTPFKSYGKYVVVDHGNGMQTLYAHLSERDVRAGEMVKRGQALGRVGHTGNATGDHLHLETWWNGKSVPPGKFGIPGLNVGGQIRYDNTLANLHKNERVLTAPLSAKLESGIDKMDNDNGSVYHVNMSINGPFDSQIDFQKGVEDALVAIDKRKGVKRSI